MVARAYDKGSASRGTTRPFMGIESRRFGRLELVHDPERQLTANRASPCQSHCRAPSVYRKPITVPKSKEKEGLLIMVLCQDWRYQHRRPDIPAVVKTAPRLPRPAVRHSGTSRALHPLTRLEEVSRVRTQRVHSCLERHSVSLGCLAHPPTSRRDTCRRCKS